MKKLLMAIAATTASLFVLFPVKHVQAASLGLTVTENDTDNTIPVPGTDNNLYFFTNTVSAQGQITSVDGFSSLQGVNPSNLTLNFGNLTLLTYSNQGGIVNTISGNDGAKNPYFNLLENGQVIATSNNIKITNSTNINPDSPDYGQAKQDVEIALNGVSGNPFYQEVQQITNGTGILNINLGSPTSSVSSPLTGPDAAASFTYTGGTLVASTSTPTEVPEPSEVGAFLVMGAGWLLRKKGGSILRDPR